jgi:hypothetical protein
MWVVNIIDGFIGVGRLMFIVLVRSVIPERNQIMMFCRQMHDDAVTGYKSMIKHNREHKPQYPSGIFRHSKPLC